MRLHYGWIDDAGPRQLRLTETQTTDGTTRQTHESHSPTAGGPEALLRVLYRCPMRASDCFHNLTADQHSRVELFRMYVDDFVD